MKLGIDDNGAIRYAKGLIQDGLADSVWVNFRYHRPFGDSFVRNLAHLEVERLIEVV